MDISGIMVGVLESWLDDGWHSRITGFMIVGVLDICIG